MTRGPRVYIPNLSGHDFTDALRYGELVYVTKGQLEKFATNSFYRAWIDALKDSQPGDYILQTGLGTLCSVGCAVFGAMHGRLNLLLWRTNKYVSREIVFTDLMGEEEE